jgi:hypothetical protein
MKFKSASIRADFQFCHYIHQTVEPLAWFGYKNENEVGRSVITELAIF